MKNSKEVVTFGCRLNIYESEVIKKNLDESGLDNVIVFNTCTVTAEAEKQAKQAIRKAKRDNPDCKIIVTGCAAQKHPEIFAAMSEVDKILGNEEKLHSTNYKFDEDKVLVNDIMSVTETAHHLVTNFEGRARAFIQIQNGCNHRCTFCIIPYARGNSRSVPIGMIVEQIKKLVDTGYNEIVFTGVDVTSYGPDLPGQPTFAQMIRRVLLQVPELKRLRLSSIDVAEIDEDLFDLMAYEARLMPHFHISLQAGDDLILKRMKRRHDRASVLKYCDKLRSIRSNVSYGADIIAGFPTETDEMFENTLNLVSEAGLQYLHVFPYSERDGTPAARMPQVDVRVRKERAALIRNAGEKELRKFMQKNIGMNTNIIVENDNIGRTENFLPVKIVNHFYVPGDIVSVKLQDCDFSKMVMCIGEW
jgi:threonylcarbamoyladenosine tRNA methylthiotransferase MtaB